MNKNGGTERLVDGVWMFENAATAMERVHGGAQGWTCKRVPENGVLYCLSKDVHPMGGACSLRSLAAFVFECLATANADEGVELSPEGVNGLLTLLNVMQWGLEEIEECFEPPGNAHICGMGSTEP